MTVNEAKKILEMSTDTIRKINDDRSEYINKDYVLKVLDMIEETPHLDYPDIPSFPWNPMNPGVTYDGKGQWVWRKISTGTGDNAPGEWHLVYEKEPDPYTPYCNDLNSTGNKPMTPDIHVTCDDSVKFANIDSSMYHNDGTVTTLSSSDKTVDVSPKRTDYIDDFESTTSKDLNVKRTDYIDDFKSGTSVV